MNPTILGVIGPGFRNFIRVPYMNPTILGVIGPGFLNQVPTLGFLTPNQRRLVEIASRRMVGRASRTSRVLPCS